MTEPGTRAERKERTRQALIEGTLDLLRDRSFASVSLREVTRSAGIVPTAFYRHFASMEDLGVALVEDSMRMLRQMLRDARKDPSVKNATESLRILVSEMRSHEDQFRFMARERYGGVTEVRKAFATELRLFVSELTIDLSRMPGLENWDIADLEMAADLIVSTMLTATVGLLEIDRPGSDKEKELLRRTEQQVRLIVLGMGVWRPR
ncbi:MAG: TetR family transcriptional regulator [Rhodococcus sp. (in: high G+C Gram-positive bacteria)]